MAPACIPALLLCKYLHSAAETYIMNIQVSNLSRNIIARDLEILFSSYGQVSFVTVVRNTTTGRSMGLAFIEMPQHAQAEQAVLALDKIMMDGKEIMVKEMEYKAGEFNN